MRLRRLALIAGLAGCGPVRQEVPLDELCVIGEYLPDGGMALSEGAPLRLAARNNISTSCRPACDTVVERSCSVTREGNTFRVRGRVVVDVDCQGNNPPPVCMIHAAECTTEPLPAGEYTLTDGTRSLPFRVPSTLPSARNCTPATP